jgi:1-acyl-sn-glycerol-3-phosphate acyltransferase
MQAPISWPGRLARDVLQPPTLAVLDLLAPDTIYGREALDALEGPVLLAANHTSHLDTPVILHALPPARRRRVAVAAAADYFFTRPRLGALVALLFGAVPFGRGRSAWVSLNECAGLLRAGGSVLLYPEGTRTTTGHIGPFRPGAGFLAVETGIPVVPIRTEGLFGIFPKGGRLPRPGRVTVYFGAPLRFAGDVSHRAASAAIEAAVRALGPGADAQEGGSDGRNL